MENELSKGFTGVEINGVRFSNIGEMLRYMDKQRKQLIKAKELIELLLSDNRTMKAQFESEEQVNIWFEHIHQAEQFLKDSEVEK